ncbi:coil containing protein [Vibrio phage 1.164.O._10N.261.51.A7]|nr:coil containing protein [Vibrio phage 1.164.O._10N.261.51.A7]
MKPSTRAKQLGAKTASAVAASYGMLPQQLYQIHDADLKRFESMVRTHVLSVELNVSCQHLEFLMEQVASNMKGNNAANYFLNDPEAKKELTCAYVVDFRVRIRDMCQQLLANEKASEVVQSLIGEKLSK